MNNKWRMILQDRKNEKEKPTIFKASGSANIYSIRILPEQAQEQDDNSPPSLQQKRKDRQVIYKNRRMITQQIYHYNLKQKAPKVSTIDHWKCWEFIFHLYKNITQEVQGF